MNPVSGILFNPTFTATNVKTTNFRYKIYASPNSTPRCTSKSSKHLRNLFISDQSSALTVQYAKLLVKMNCSNGVGLDFFQRQRNL